MVRTLSEATSASIREAIDKVTADKNKIPGLVAIVVEKDGKWCSLTLAAPGARRPRSP